MTINVAVAGTGAFGNKHLEALSRIDDARVVALVEPDLDRARSVADTHGVPSVASDLDEVLERSDVDAVVLATPTPLHAAQAMQCLRAGKHVEVEIPMCDRLADGEALVALQSESGLVAMCGHTRRFNPSHQWIRCRILDDGFHIQHMDVQTYFFRRTNTNAAGQPRSWTDHLLWHHAAHSVDLFLHQTGGALVDAHAIQGPIHPELGIAMDMSIHLKVDTGAILTLSLSFNNAGPFGTTFRYIGDTGTYIARYDDLTDGDDEPIDVSAVAVSLDGIELQDREFIDAIRHGREPEASVARVLPCYRVLADLEAMLAR